MRAVWKFDLPMIDNPTIRMPAGAEILHIAEQAGRVRLWALVDPDRFDESRSFRVAGTGHEIDDTHLSHVGTFLMHDSILVFHVFEIGRM